MTLPRRPWTVQDVIVCTLPPILSEESACMASFPPVTDMGPLAFKSILVLSNHTQQLCPVSSSWQTDPLLPTVTVSVSLPVTPWAGAWCVGETCFRMEGSLSAPSRCPGTGQEMFVLNV